MNKISLSDIGLLTDPFQLKMVYDMSDLKKYPFIQTESQKIIKGFLEQSFLLPFDWPVYYLIIGERGSGKTSTLLWLLDFLNSKNDNRFVGKYEASVSGMDDIESLSYKLLPDRRVTYYENKVAVDNLKSFLQQKRYYWFLDVPDTIGRDDMYKMLKGLQILLGFKNISIFVAMNFSHYERSFRYSEILGKFTVVKLNPFTLEETKNLIYSRIQEASINKSNPPKIFSDKTIEIIWKVSRGIPRNILSACDILLTKCLQYGLKEIDDNSVREILGEDLAKRIIEERINYEKERVELYKIYLIIKDVFKGEAIGQENLVEKVKEEFGWSRLTVIKKIKKLESLGLIKVDKAPSSWANVIRVVV